jgi:peptide deformylase
MILPVYGYGHPVLRKIAEEIPSDYPGFSELIQNMFETMKSSNGVGLAAPQVGIGIRLFVIDAAPYAEEIDKQYSLRHVFVNPEIIEESGEPWVFEEGCLSIPDIREDVLRHPVIKIKFQNEHFEHFEKVFDGMIARIIQHEYDHLEGVMFVDHVSNLRKMLLRKRLGDIVQGRISPGYKMKYASIKR